MEKREYVSFSENFAAQFEPVHQKLAAGGYVGREQLLEDTDSAIQDALAIMLPEGYDGEYYILAEQMFTALKG